MPTSSEKMHLTNNIREAFEYDTIIRLNEAIQLLPLAL